MFGDIPLLLINKIKIMKIKSTGNVVGNQRTKSIVSSEMQNKLNGLTLGQAIAKGLLVNDDTLKFETVITTYHGAAGSKTYERVVLHSNEGDIRLSEPLAEGDIIDWIDRLGDLTFSAFESNKGNKVFQLQKPGGGVEERREEFMAKEFAEA